MWICTDGPMSENNDMSIMTFEQNGQMSVTGFVSENKDALVNQGGMTYNVVGDLLIQIFPKEGLVTGSPQYIATRLIYSKDGTSLGDIMTQKVYAPSVNAPVEMTSSYLRVKQSLDLTGKKYDYSNLYISNVKGLDKEMDFLGFKFNFGKMDGSRLDKMLKTLLFTIEFPDAKHIKYTLHHYNVGPSSLEAPITVDGNKVTIKMSEIYPAVKDVDFYTFQDADGCQLHMYMSTSSVVNFFLQICRL